MIGRLIFIMAIILIMVLVYCALNAFGKENIEKTVLIYKAVFYFVVAVGTAAEMVFILEKEVTVLQVAIIIVSFIETFTNAIQLYNNWKNKGK